MEDLDAILNTELRNRNQTTLRRDFGGPVPPSKQIENYNGRSPRSPKVPTLKQAPEEGHGNPLDQPPLPSISPRMTPPRTPEEQKSGHPNNSLGQIYPLGNASPPKPMTQAQVDAAAMRSDLEGTIRRVLIIYTGGTIGMKETPNGLAPVAGYLPALIPTLNEFYDPHESAENFNVSPVSAYGKRIQWEIIEFEPIIDSSDMNMDDWIKISKTIEEHYKRFDGFVVLHGTDTMAYTSSALSFLLQGLGKTVVLTGSQIPLSKQRSDGRSNLLGALIMAGHFSIPEVCLFFNNKLMRGNRVTKSNSSDLDGFTSPNLSPVATMGVTIKINWEMVYHSRDMRPMHSASSLENNISICSLFPGINKESIRNALKPPMKGVVLRSFGAGNAPMRTDILDIFKEAADRGVVIVNVSQCYSGNVIALYEAGRVLLKYGVVPGHDMTVEAALAKLSFLLAQGLTVEEVRLKISEDIQGELTPPQTTDQFELNKFNSAITDIATALNAKNNEQIRKVAEAIWPTLLCTSAGNGDLDAVKEMVKNGANVRAADYDGRTALHLAASEGHPDVVTYLLSKGVSVHARDRWGSTPLQDAKTHGNQECADILTNIGALA